MEAELLRSRVRAPLRVRESPQVGLQNGRLMIEMSSDPSVIERYAAGLQQKAGSRVTRLTLLGFLIGAGVGATPVVAPLVSSVHSLVPHRYAYAAAIIATFGGGYLGFVIGQSRAVALRLQASMALHQIELGRMLHRVEALSLPLPAEETAPEPEPELEAEPEPEPEAEPEPEPAPPISPPANAPVVSLPAPPTLPPAALQPVPVPTLTAVPPTFEWPQPQSAARSDAT